MMAGLCAAAVLASVRALDPRVARPNVIEKLIDHDDRHDHRNHETEETGWEPTGPVESATTVIRPAQWQDVLQSIIVPDQQEYVGQQHERGDARPFKPDSVGQHTNVQDDREIENCAQQRSSRHE